MTKIIPTCLIEKNTLFSEGLKNLLIKTNFEITGIYPDIKSANNKETGNKHVALVIVGIEDGAHDLPTTLKSAKNTFPESRVVVLAMQTNLACMVSCFSSGADGYILRNVPPPVILGSLNMVMAGEKAYPAALLTSFIKQEALAKEKSSIFRGCSLSGRELEILTHLAHGETNKEIAIFLNITEATVKVHVKTILRKLNLSNRTQAALWAVGEGIVKHDTATHRQAIVA